MGSPQYFLKRFGAKFLQSWLEIIRLTKNKVEKGLQELDGAGVWRGGGVDEVNMFQSLRNIVANNAE